MVSLFWSADRNNYKEMIAEIYAWFLHTEVRQRLELIVFSLDETGEGKNLTK